MSAMLITYGHFFAPKPPVQAVHTQKQETVAAGSTAYHPEQVPTLATHAPSEPAPYGIFAPVVQGVEKEVILENEVLKVVLTSKGGIVKEVVLKQYKDHKNQPLTLLDAHSSLMGFQLPTHDQQVYTHALFFETTDQDQCVEATETAGATFTLPIGPHQYIRHRFTLPGEGYVLHHTWEIVGLGDASDQQPLQFLWDDHIKRVEKDVKACRHKTTINYYSVDGKFGHLKEHADKEQTHALQSPIQWIGIKQRFFTAGLITAESFVGGHITTVPTHQHTTTVKEAKVRLILPAHNLQQDYKGSFTFYFGPNDYHTLKKVTKGFSKNISLGWPIVRWLNRYLIIPIFTFLEQYISSYGIIIILLVLFIKCLLLPLSYRSYVAMAKMRVLKPALDAIKDNHSADIQKMQMEQMRLYREMGVNPLSGCIPVLLQMPILLAMFNFFPNAIALRQKAFLWASDLSTYDAIMHLPFSIPAYGSHVSLFTLLMTASTILYTWSNEQFAPSQQGPLKIMSYMMPLTFMFILNSFPAGLSLYYFVSNLVTFGQQRLIKYVVDEEKIQKKLKENKLKNRDSSRSRFQTHLKNSIRLKSKRNK